MYRLVNIPLDKIYYIRELGLVIDITKFDGYKKDLILNFVRKQIGQKKITGLKKESLHK